jgi:phthalate 4,5-dioxygenase
MHAGRGIHVKLMGGTFTPAANQRNGYLMDRAAQRAKETFSGVSGVGVQDAAVQESMGAIQDRTRENLVSSDNNIVMARRRLMDAAGGVARGVAPPGLDPRVQRARAVSMVVPRAMPLADAIAQAQDR